MEERGYLLHGFVEAYTLSNSGFPCPRCGQVAQRNATYCTGCGMLFGNPVAANPKKQNFERFLLFLLVLGIIGLVIIGSQVGLGYQNLINPAQQGVSAQIQFNAISKKIAASAKEEVLSAEKARPGKASISVRALNGDQFSQDDIPRGSYIGQDNIIWGAYAEMLRWHIRRYWKPPLEDGDKRVTTVLKISQAGKLLDIKILKSSGNQAYDKAAIDAINASNPFYRLPPLIKDPNVNVELAFEYSSKPDFEPHTEELQSQGKKNWTSEYGREPDFGPYIEALQSRIRKNWSPPIADKERMVVAFFKIDRQGKLLSLTLKTHSGIKKYDQAALDAVRASAPFPPLPVGYKDKDIDVVFTFDYDLYQRSSNR